MWYWYSLEFGGVYLVFGCSGLIEFDEDFGLGFHCIVVCFAVVKMMYA